MLAHRAAAVEQHHEARVAQRMAQRARLERVAPGAQARPQRAAQVESLAARPRFPAARTSQTQTRDEAVGIAQCSGETFARNRRRRAGTGAGTVAREQCLPRRAGAFGLRLSFDCEILTARGHVVVRRTRAPLVLGLSLRSAGRFA